MKKTLYIKLTVIIFMLFTNIMLAYADEVNPLPVDQAFQFQLSASNTDSLIANWQIAKGYYLYKNRFAFKVIEPKTALLGNIVLPKGILKNDKILGPHEVYENQLQISLPVANSTQQNLVLQINYQGCSSEGFCYPPQLKQFSVDATGQVTEQMLAKIMPMNVAINTTPNQTDKLSNILQNRQGVIAISIFLLLGILLAFTPCVLPMIPILAGILAGQDGLGTRRAFLLSLTYVLSMACTFAIAGILVATLGSNIQVILQNPWVLGIFSLLFLILAMSLFGFFELKLPNYFEQKIAKMSHKQKSGNFLGVAMMGILATLIVSPCVSAPLVGALAYIAQTGDKLFGAMALFALGFGMGLPLLLVGGSLGKWLPKSGPWLEKTKAILGVLLLAVAIDLLSRFMPMPIILILSGVTFIIAASYLGLCDWPKVKPIEKLNLAFNLLLLALGFYYVSAGLNGQQSFFINHQTSQTQINSALPWQTVTNLKDAQAI